MQELSLPRGRPTPTAGTEESMHDVDARTPCRCRTSRACLVLFAAMGALLGCRREPLVTQYDLERESDHAEWVFPPGISVTLTPTLQIHFSPAALADRALEGRRGPSRLEARVFVRGAVPAGHAADLLLEVEPAARGATLLIGRDGQSPELLEPGRRRHVVPLAPSETGTVIELAVEPPPGVLLSRTAVRLRRAAVVPEAWLRRRGPVSPAKDGARALVQVGPSTVRFALPLPPAAELRFTLGTEASAGPVRTWVTLEAGGADEREVWSASRSPGSPGTEEVAVPLARRPGPARVSFHVEGPPGVPVRATWGTPRVLGRGSADGLRARPHRPPDRARGKALRSALAGANVLVLVLDAAAARHFGCYGYERPTTLNVDRIAREGVLFERAYALAPFTIAAMSSMWTSQYPDEHHAGIRHRAPLPPEPLTLAELLSARGVSTAGFVANPSAGPPFGLHRGFGQFHLLYDAGEARFSGVRRAEEFRPLLRDWLSRVGPRRFFAYVHYLEPHFPYDPPAPFDRLFGPVRALPTEARRDDGWVNRVNASRHSPSADEAADLVRLYDGSLTYVDREVGWLRQTLERLGLLERTVIVVTADHGESLLERGSIGHGAHVYEECVRVPFVVRFPSGRGPAALRVTELVDHLDVAPTVADIFGVLDGPAARQFEGVSLLDVVAGAPGKGVVVTRTMQERPTYSLSDGRWKLIHSLKTGRRELYDLSRDPDEGQDLVGAEPLWAELTRQELYRWLRDLRPGTVGSTEEVLTPAEIETLRALGYVR